MQRIFTNLEPANKNRLDHFLNQQAKDSELVRVATAYFTHDGLTTDFFKKTDVKLMVGLNETLNLKSLKKAYKANNIAIKYYVQKFHPKIYLFSNGVVVVGSSNYTIPGIGHEGSVPNQECNIATDDPETYEEVSDYFDSLWGNAKKLGEKQLVELERLQKKLAALQIKRKEILDRLITPEIDPEYFSESLHGKTFSAYDNFLEDFKDLSELYFKTIGRLTSLPKNIEVDKFLNWLCRKYEDDRAGEIVNREERSKIIIEYLYMFGADEKGQRHFFNQATGNRIIMDDLLSRENIRKLNAESLKLVAIAIYSFQMREFEKFIEKNGVHNIIESLNYLLYSDKDIKVRLHGFLHGKYKLDHFRVSRTLEILGWADNNFPIWSTMVARGMTILGYSDFVGKDKILN